MISALSSASAAGLHGLALAVPLVAAVLLFGWWFSRRKWQRRKKPGQYLVYRVPGKTALEVRGALGRHGDGDLFAYGLTGAAAGGWYVHFTGHKPTRQQLDTLFLLQFEGDEPAIFSIRFVREAFGMREPVIGEELLDAFFAQKLGAERVPETSAPGDEGPKAG